MKTFDRSFAEIYYHEGIHAVEIKWKSFATVENYKETLESAFNVVTAKSCKYWISDMTQGRAVPQEASDWLREEYIPKVLNRGIQKVAFLLDNNAIRTLYAQTIKGNIESNHVPLRYFTNRSELLAWIGGSATAQAASTRAAIAYHHLIAAV